MPGIYDSRFRWHCKVKSIVWQCCSTFKQLNSNEMARTYNNCLSSKELLLPVKIHTILLILLSRFSFFPSTLGLLFSVYSVLCFFFAAVWWYCLQHWSQHADVLDVSLKRSSIFEVFCLFVCLFANKNDTVTFFLFFIFSYLLPESHASSPLFIQL